MLTLDQKRDIFQPELLTIHSDRLRDATVVALGSLPDYFFNIPASSSGRYHPNYAQGNGGLVRHTKAAVFFCNTLLQLNHQFTDTEEDLMRMALLLHDGFKKGLPEEKHTVFEHPLIAAKWLRDDTLFESYLEHSEREFLYQVISSHMGQWNWNQSSETELPLPETNAQKFVHLCDYLASRKCLEILFDENNNISADFGSIFSNKNTVKQLSDAEVLDYILDFGKYKGMSVKTVLESYRGYDYLSWCHANAHKISPQSKWVLQRIMLMKGYK